MTPATGAGQLDIVGLGEGGGDGLTAAAQRAIASAQLLVGGERHLALTAGLAAPDCVRLGWGRPFNNRLEEIRAAVAAGQRVVVLASGDPSWHGVASQFSRFVAPLRIHPQPSAFQLAAARLGWDLGQGQQRSTACFSVHGWSVDNARRFIQAGRRFIALGTGETPAAIAAQLVELHCADSEVIALSHLGGAQEQLRRAPARDWSSRFGAEQLPALTTVAVDLIQRQPLPLLPGLPDDCFRHDGQLTKREVRAVTLAKLGGSGLLWDVGAGCGSVAIEWLRSQDDRTAIAFEQDEARSALMAHNARWLGVPELQIRTERFDAHSQAPTPDSIFIGGGLTDGLLAHCWAALTPGGHLVANAVTTKGERLLTAFAEQHQAGEGLCRLAVERARPVGRLLGWQPLMTVTQLALRKPWGETA